MADREKTLTDITEIEKDFNEIEQQYFNLADREPSSDTSDDSEQDETDVEDCGDDFNLLNIAEDEEPAAQPQNLVHDQPAGAGPEQAVPNVVSLKNKAKCTCTAPCINSFESEPIELGRTVLLGLTRECHDLVVLGKLSAFLHGDSHTRRSKKAEQGERKRLRSDYTHEGRSICRNSFKYINAIGDFRLRSLAKHYFKEGHCDSRMFNYSLGHGRNSKALIKEDTERIRRFLRTVSSVHGLDLPGRLPDNSSLNGLVVLPSDYTKEKLHNDYTQACEAAGWRCIGLSTFKNVLKLLVPNLIISKPKTDLCWTCQKGHRRALELTNVDEAEKLQVLADSKEHLEKAAAAREYMKDCQTRAKECIGDAVMGEHEPLSGPALAHYGFDYAQQVFYPNDPMQPGPIFFKVPRRCALFGVCATALPRQVNYLVDEAGSTGKGSNSVISFLHHFLSKHGLGEKHLILHADNCCGQNKNNSMMAYLEWRVSRGLHLSIEMNFLVAGHTKFTCDLCFGLVKRKYRRTRVSSLQQLAEVVDRCSKANEAQLVCDQDGSVIVKQYDWAKFLGNTRKIKGIKKCHQFFFSSDKPGTVRLRTFLGEPATEHQIFSGTIEGHPPELHPEGLSLERRWYLFNEIREFCDADHMDLVCPKPNEQQGAPTAVQEEEEEVEQVQKPKRRKKTK